MIKGQESVKDWNDFYSKANPWGLDGSLADFIRIKIINNCFKNKNFKNGIDIACGEGFLLNNLDFIKKKKGIDLSINAINRAKQKYPNIEFYVGNPFLDFNLDEKFEFVSCFEGLYYPTSLKDRKKALKNLLRYGTKDATYALSVVTIGTNIYGDFYTKESFLDLLSENYEVLKIVTLTGEYKLPIHLRILQKCISILNKKIAANLYFEHMINAKEEDIYQELFICKSIHN